MSVMPEASSALFMSQFTDEAVRDAIARVSSLYSVHVAPTTSPAILLRWLQGAKASDIYNGSRSVCSDDVVCLGLRKGSEEILFLEYNLRFPISLPAHLIRSLKLEIFIALISRLAVFFLQLPSPPMSHAI